MNTSYQVQQRHTEAHFFSPEKKAILKRIRSIIKAHEMISYFCVLNRQGRIVSMNDRFAALFRSANVDCGMKIVPYLKQLGLGRLALRIWKTLQKYQTFHQELALIEDGKNPIWFDVTVAPYHDESNQLAGAIAMLFNISERKQIEETMAFHAYHDALTSLPNRRLLEDRLQQACLRADRSGEKFALLFVDLDRFKQVNDTYGHRIGDAVLVQIASRIRSVLRREDTVCRQGGDEFIILLPGIKQPEAAAAVARKVIDSVSNPICIENIICHVGASVGIALYPDHDQRPDRLIQFADRAMYRAKNTGSQLAMFANAARSDMQVLS